MLRFTSAFLSIVLLAGIARAGDLTVSGQPFSVNIQREPVNTQFPIFRAFVTMGDNKFTFIVPEKFSTGGDPGHGRLQFKTLEGDNFATFNFVDTDGGLTLEGCRAFLLAKYSGGKIVQEISRPVGGRNGMQFDVNWRSSSGFDLKTRAIYFPTPAGTVELTITSGAKKFNAAKDSLGTILTTFTSSTDGNLVVARLASSN